MHWPPAPRVVPFRPGSFRSGIRDERTAAVLGIALGVSFSVCFGTGVLSHLVQDSSGWFHLPARPAGIYHWSQGIHVATGLATIPLLLAKLWVVFPKLFEWPPFESITHLVERLALLPLIGGGLLLLLTGLGNINIWRPWDFSFRTGHYAAAWITIGAMVVHIGAKWTTTRSALRRDAELTIVPDARPGGLDRRSFLATTFGIGGLVTLFTVGQTFSPLRRLALLAPRRPDIGPQGFPVNRLARSVGLAVIDIDTYRLIVDGPGVRTPLTLSYGDLESMAQHTSRIAITCVEGWSTTQTWTGVPVRDLLRLAGAGSAAEAVVYALHDGRISNAPINADQAHDSDTLLALRVNGDVLAADHGFPARLIGHNRPGVHQIKWVGRIEVR